ncbi:MAG: hypothetical protein K2Y01_01280 [Rhabdochlamydiaceae bacterium]|nr:hypothetical protein [Rhabdochlamydiaceae bacterium]
MREMHSQIETSTSLSIIKFTTLKYHRITIQLKNEMKKNLFFLVNVATIQANASDSMEDSMMAAE